MSLADNERGPGGDPDLDSTLDVTADQSDQRVDDTARVKGMTADGQVIADYRHCFGLDQARGWRSTLHKARVA